MKCERKWLLLVSLTTALGCSQTDNGDGPSIEHVEQALEGDIDEQFNGLTLDPAWSTWDGYSLEFPLDLSHHAQFANTGSHFQITIPSGGQEHNQWWFRHAAALRDYPGSGVYEFKMDGTVYDDHQFGLVFQQDTHTFLQFMFYVEQWGEIFYYAERFSNVDGNQYKTTLWPSGGIGVHIPATSSYYMRVTVDDDASPTAREWKWEWSLDGSNWDVLLDGILEGTSPTQNIGTINQVGLFAGSQADFVPDDFVAGFDYFTYSPELATEPPPDPLPDPVDPPELPGGVSAAGLVGWFEADTLVGVVADGAGVSTWADLSGYDAHAVSPGASASPTLDLDSIGGHASLLFDGADDSLELPSGYDDLTDGITMFAVAEPTDLQPGFKLLALGNGPGVHNVVLGRNGTTDGLQYFTTNTNGNYGWFNTNSTLTVGETTIFGLYQGAGSANSSVGATVTKNGVTVGSGSVFVPPVTTRSVNYIGKSYWPEGRFQGRLAELMLFARELSAGERAEIEAYLAAKYLGAEPPVEEPPTEEPPVEDPPVEDPPTEEPPVEDPPTEEPPVEEPPTEEPPVVDLDIPTSGLVLMLDAEELAETLADGELVSVWADGSGSGHDASAPSAGESPALVASSIGGRPAVRFDGVDDYLNLDAGFDDFTSGLSMFVVAELSNLQNGLKIVALGNGPGTHNIVLGRNGSTNGLQYFTSNASGNVGWFNTGDALYAAEPGIISVLQGAGSENGYVGATIFRDGSSVGNGSVFVPPVVTRSVNYLGKSYWNEGILEGDVAEVILYNRELDPSEVEDVESYLNFKYFGIEPPAEEPPAEDPPAEDPPAEDPPAEDPPAEDPPAEDPPAEDPPAEEPPAEDPPAEEPPAEDPTAQEPPAEDPPAEDPPADILIPTDGLEMLLDASQLGLTEGAPVDSWTDLSGLDNHGWSASAAESPTFAASGIGGQPAIVFDGVDDYFYFDTSFADFTQGMTAFIVAEPSELQSGFKFLALGNGPGVHNIVLGRNGTSDGLQYFTDNGSYNVTWFNTGSALVANQATLFGVRQGAGAAGTQVSASVTVGGVAVGGGSVWVPAVTSRSVNYLGRSYWAEGLFEGAIAEVILYRRELDTTELADVEAYLTSKYGL